MLISLRSKVKNAAVLIVRTIEDMDEFELCLFVLLSIYNAAKIGRYFSGKYPELGQNLKTLFIHLTR